ETESGIVNARGTASGSQKFESVISPDKGFFIPFDFGPLDAEQQALFLRNRLFVNIRITAIYKNPLGDESIQTISRRCLWGPNKQLSVTGDMAAVDHDSEDLGDAASS